MFKNKTAVVTGAAVGIGRATAIMLAKRGADVAILDMNTDKLNSVRDEIKVYGVKCLAYQCDVSNEKTVNEVFSEIFKAFGKVDILVNNAALWRQFTSFVETPTEIWKKFTEINVYGVVYCTKAVLPKMYENNFGRIINLASVAGYYGNGMMVPYSATKGAVISMTQALAKETAEHNVTLNAVSPGTVSPSENPDMDYYQDNPLNYAGRTGTNNENAELICFLASDAAAYINGQNILIDGCRKKI